MAQAGGLSLWLTHMLGFRNIPVFSFTLELVLGFCTVAFAVLDGSKDYGRLKKYNDIYNINLRNFLILKVSTY